MAADAKKKPRIYAVPRERGSEGRYHLAMAAMMESRGYPNLAFSHFLAATECQESP